MQYPWRLLSVVCSKRTYDMYIDDREDLIDVVLGVQSIINKYMDIRIHSRRSLILYIYKMRLQQMASEQNNTLAALVLRSLIYYGLEFPVMSNQH